ncbi:MAG TPA: hypothetical protein VKQ54_13625 [Caulobacteraceae bacterium]|nr:hypothetical protein [Caulobacteraceae bacterium]
MLIVGLRTVRGARLDEQVLGIPVLFISGPPGRARLARSVAIASLSKPYSAAELVDAVDYLFRHEIGDETRPAPLKLEMFDLVSGHGAAVRACGDRFRTTRKGLSSGTQYWRLC